MESRPVLKDFLNGRWLGHPLHPLLVHVPVALWPASLVFDSLAHLGGPAMGRAAGYAIVCGVAAAALAVPAGLADWWGIKRANPAWKLGVYHMTLNLAALAVWTLNAATRWRGAGDFAPPGAAALALSVAGTLLVAVSAYLGGRMVYHYGIGVARMSRHALRRAAQSAGANVPPE